MRQHIDKQPSYSLFSIRLKPQVSLLLAMSFPAEGIESAYRNSIDDVRVYFDTKHTDHYVVINISQRQYNVSKLNDRVSFINIFGLICVTTVCLGLGQTGQ